MARTMGRGRAVGKTQLCLGGRWRAVTWAAIGHRRWTRQKNNSVPKISRCQIDRVRIVPDDSIPLLTPVYLGIRKTAWKRGVCILLFAGGDGPESARWAARFATLKAGRISPLCLPGYRFIGPSRSCPSLRRKWSQQRLAQQRLAQQRLVQQRRCRSYCRRRRLHHPCRRQLHRPYLSCRPYRHRHRPLRHRHLGQRLPTWAMPPGPAPTRKKSCVEVSFNLLLQFRLRKAASEGPTPQAANAVRHHA